MKFIVKNAHLLKAAVYGANDGIITTFAVVAGVAGAGLSANIILILGIANMVADGISMGLGDYLGEKSERRLNARSQGKKKYDSKGTWHSGAVTVISFNIAGAFPLLPYFFKALGFCNTCEFSQFIFSIISTALALFLVGVSRTYFTKGRWWFNGLEMLGVGAIAATVAFLLGAWVERMVA